ncbi:unnamed protein product [[Actinomadura] parvosata subsp. kistnae]|uniref:Uncharacterized protein n=1 Tax=[Actinomadura] parvosata subsp. kistnae TaxID=1909395 RepID=A0A1U9ZXV6_9ACTN|nr:hypothetical protein [Nonomuraea sp. ATCC 55076]AQZ62796.1 hypothetical protein BKM31_16200 [Nonomuraea sp. ATCC 55076]SPL98318.1 unnamed protein product [Actinomadura parvosata subsp. kistnae]
MSISVPLLGRFAYYLRGKGEKLLAEIVRVGIPQAARRGAGLVDVVLAETSYDRRYRRGDLIRCFSDAPEIGEGPDKPPVKRLHLPEEALYGCFRGGRLWSWYDSDVWVPEDLGDALAHVGSPIGARLFRTLSMAQEYLERAADSEPYDTVAKVAAKTWRYTPTSDERLHRGHYTMARILSPEAPRER